MAGENFPYAELVIDDTAGDSVTIEIRTEGLLPIYLRMRMTALHRYAQEIVKNGDSYLADPEGDTAVVRLRMEHHGATDGITFDFGPNGIEDEKPASISKQVLALLFESLSLILGREWEVNHVG